MNLVYPIIIKCIGNGYMVDAANTQLFAKDKEEVKECAAQLVDAIFELKDNPIRQAAQTIVYGKPGENVVIGGPGRTPELPEPKETQAPAGSFQEPIKLKRPPKPTTEATDS